MLTKQQKKEWLDALKSGKYIRGTGQLLRNGKHCCLGVLAEILPNVKLSPCGCTLLNDNDYGKFNELLGSDTVDLLYKTNDSVAAEADATYALRFTVS